LRLQSYISKSGITSRRKAAEWIKAGKVSVDGKTVLEPGCAIDPEKADVVCNGQHVRGEKKVYFLFHKPRNVISTVTDNHSRRTVTDFFKSIPERLYPVGRLDRDTTGLLVMTNDGELANRLMHPRYTCDKTYELQLDRPLSPSQIKYLEKGVRIDGKKTAPCKIRPLSKQSAKRGAFAYRIILHEGRKRQIRHMMEIVKAAVVTLHRVQVGNLKLGNLKPGTYRALTAAEVKSLLTSA